MNGTPQPPTPLTSFSLWEWPLPWIEAAPGSNVSGTLSLQTESIGGDIQQPGPPPFATCKYQFSKASPASSTNPTLVTQNCPPANTVAQTFDAMKANIAQQFDGLIQQTQDPARKAALSAQKQRLLGEVDNLKLQNVRFSAQTCQGYSGTSTAQNPGNSGTSGTSPSQSTPGQSSNQTGGTGNTQPGGTGNTQAAGGTGGQSGTGMPTSPQFSAIAPPVNALSTGTPRTIAQGVQPTFTAVSGTPAAPTADVTGAQVTTTQAPTGTQGSTGMSGPTASSSVNPNSPGGGNFVAPGVQPQFSAVPGATSASASTPASNQGPVSGKYLVTMTGLWCAKPTHDDPLDFDGHGDEVYAAAFVRKYDRKTTQIQEYYARQTRVYGDSNKSDRIQAGSQTQMGGVRAFDSVPNNATADRRVAPQDNSLFPYKLWGGTLTDGAEALVISPSVWESDGEPSFFYIWNQNQNTTSNSIFLDTKLQDLITSRKFATLTSGVTAGTAGGAGRVADDVILSTTLTMLGIPALPFFVRGHDRPIGLVESGPDQNALPNTAVVLTREIIETALASPYATLATPPAPGIAIPINKPGIMVVTFADDSNNIGGNSTLGDARATYVMTLQVERCEGSDAQFCPN
jgi:hypothetical protein